MSTGRPDGLEEKEGRHELMDGKDPGYSRAWWQSAIASSKLQPPRSVSLRAAAHRSASWNASQMPWAVMGSRA